MWLLGIEILGPLLAPVNSAHSVPACSGPKIYLLLYISTLSSDTPEEGSDLITGGCEPPCGCWDLNSVPSEEQSVLLTSEPSLQPLDEVIFIKKQSCLRSPAMRSALLRKSAVT